MCMRIIPEPKKIKLADGAFEINNKIVMMVAKGQDRYLTKIMKLIKGKVDKEIQIRYIENKRNIVMFSNTEDLPNFNEVACATHKEEGYELEITRDRVLVKGQDEAGFFYGIQTLYQLIEDDTNLPCCRIQDWPDMKMRGVHFDLKGCMPTFEYLKDAIIRLGSFKINTILMEYEDKITYKNHPLLASSSALSIEEVKELVNIAKENHIQIIPLVQSLGHAEYILKHSEYAHLREQQDFYQQMCPSKPETMEFFKSLCEELFDIHKDSKYFHIGGDETRQLGECSICQPKALKESKYKLYMDYVKEACQFILDNGKIPIIWDDILTCHAPELFKELPKGTVIVYWKYYFTSETLNYCQGLSGIVTSKQWTTKQYNDYSAPSKYGPFEGASAYRKQASMFLPPAATDILEELPKEQYELYEKYADTDQFPKEMSSTPFVKFIQDHGLGIIGASGVQTAHDTLLTNPERAIPNIRLWAKSIVENEEIGVISTAWTRNQGLEPVNGTMEGMWHAFAASGEYYWTSDGVSDRQFDEKFCWRFYGLDGLEVTDAIWLIRHQKLVPHGKKLQDVFNELSKKAIRNQDNLRYHGLISKLFHLEATVDSIQDLLPGYFYMKHHRVLEDRINKKYHKQLADLEIMIKDVKDEMENVYGLLLHTDEVTDCINSFFSWYEHLVNIYKAV